MALPSGFTAISRTLAERNYGIYTAGNATSVTGIWIQRIAVGWLTWELTVSGTWLGIMAFADLFPAVVVGLVAGVVADRMSRLRMLIIGHMLLLMQALALTALTFAGLIGVPSLLVLVLFGGVVSAFNQPARLALIPSLVSRPQVSTAIAINSVVFNTARFIGPALAGVLIISGGVAFAFAVNALTFLAFLLALARIRLHPDAEMVGRKHRSMFEEIDEGLRYIARHAGIGPILLLLLVTSIGVRPIAELLPGFADAVFGRGADALAMLSASIGIGAAIGGVWLAQRGPKGGLSHLVLVSAIATAAAVLGFVATDVLFVAMLFAALAGAGMTASGVGAQTLVQMSVDAGMRGRVLGVYGIIFRGAPAIGALIMGAISDILGLRVALALGAVFTVAAWALIWRGRARIESALEPREEEIGGAR